MNLSFTPHFQFWAVLVSGVLSLFIGFIWYGPLFGKRWAAYTGWTDEKVKALGAARMARTYLLAFAAAMLQAAVLMLLSRSLGANVWSDGLLIGLATGIGLVALAFATTGLFERQPIGLWLIVSGYEVVYLAAAGVLVTVWK